MCNLPWRIRLSISSCERPAAISCARVARPPCRSAIHAILRSTPISSQPTGTTRPLGSFPPMGRTSSQASSATGRLGSSRRGTSPRSHPHARGRPAATKSAHPLHSFVDPRAEAARRPRPIPSVPSGMGAGVHHDALLGALTRRGLLQRASLLSLGALVAYAGPTLRALEDAAPAEAAATTPLLVDATLQAFADTMIPGRKATTTDLGNAIHPQAIAGVDDLPGAVETDALALYHHPKIGFDALAPAFLADLEAKALPHGNTFLGPSFDDRVKACVQGLDFGNPTRIVWEAAAAVPFTAFCAAALAPEQTAARASGYRVMGLPGATKSPYRAFTYKRKLNRERTAKGYLP